MGGVSGWQISGPYIAASASLVWSATLEFRRRRFYRATLHSTRVALRPDLILDPAGRVERTRMALTNVGTGSMYEAELRVRATNDEFLRTFVASTPHLRPDDAMTLDLPDELTLDATGTARFEAVVTWRKRPGSRVVHSFRGVRSPAGLSQLGSLRRHRPWHGDRPLVVGCRPDL